MQDIDYTAFCKCNTEWVRNSFSLQQKIFQLQFFWGMFQACYGIQQLSWSILDIKLWADKGLSAWWSKQKPQLAMGESSPLDTSPASNWNSGTHVSNIRVWYLIIYYFKLILKQKLWNRITQENVRVWSQRQKWEERVILPNIYLLTAILNEKNGRNWNNSTERLQKYNANAYSKQLELWQE